MTALELLARATAKRTKATTEWSDAIMEAYFDGASLREMAAAAGMTHVGVKRLIERHPNYVAPY
jgi:hypothetical protein